MVDVPHHDYPRTPVRGRGEPKEKEQRDAGVLVIGLGRFGSSIALTLDRLGHDVLAVERSSNLIQHFTGRFPLVEADATNPDALLQLGAKDFPVAVVGVGTSLEASVLITGNLVDLGTPQIWAKAISVEHSRILQRIGAHHVVLPEADAGNRVAHLVSGKLLDYIEVEDGFTIVKMRPLHRGPVADPQALRRDRDRREATRRGVRLRHRGHPDLRQRPSHRLGARRPARAVRVPALSEAPPTAPQGPGRREGPGYAVRARTGVSGPLRVVLWCCGGG